uniref:PBZ-type domain-containing protein n=1 Tax=Gouania willdenowi TaxID=441366 RepID=A0A8C5FZA4_GOUWI
MSFILVSLDGEGSVQVPQGQTVLGRGSFLKVTDRRVSRCHALMDNVDGRLRIKPTHLNPCFVWSRPLPRDCWFSLRPGDVFSLLPGHFLYRVDLQNQATPRLEGEESEEESPPTAEPLTEARVDHFKIKATHRKRVLPTWMMKAVRGRPAVKEQAPPSVTSPVETKPQTSMNTDCTEPPEIPKTRTRCQYGTNCYRKNPVHFQDFSHPGDSDFEEEEQPQCPYGLQCYRSEVTGSEAEAAGAFFSRGATISK